MATRMQQRRGTATQWTTANPILAAGEIGFESGTNKFKIGDGVNTWSALTYYASASEIANLIDGAPDLLNTLNELAAAIGDDANFGSTIEMSINTSVDESNTFTTAAVNTHRAITQNVHGIADTSLLATTANVATAKSEAIAAAATDAETRASGAQSAAIASAAGTADTKIGTHNSTTTNVHGIADTAVLATATTVATAKSEALASAATDATNKVATGKTEAIEAAATASESYSDASITTHNNDTTGVHGIADTSALALTATVATNLTNAITAHNDDTTNVHGIADTALLATKLYADGKASDAQSAATAAAATAAGTALTTHEEDTTNVHGIADTSALALTATVNSGLALKANLAGPTFTGTVSGITKTMVGLDNVDNTTDAGKPVSTATQTALDAKAPLASPTLTGVPTAPTAAAGTSTTQVATTAFVGTAVSDLVSSSPAALDTLNELATALGNDASFSTTVTNSLALKAPLASPTFTGTNNVAALTASGLITASASGVAFTDGTQTKEGVASRTPIVQKTASYTLSALTERDSLIEVSSATGVTITIPTNTAVAYPIGTSIDILQTGAGQVTIAAVDGTVTVNATPGLKLRTTWSSATLFKRAANTWVVFGDLTA